MATTATAEADTVLEGLSVVDCDAHFSEPPDLWTSRAPKSMQDRVPVMRTLDDGISAWYLDDFVFASTGGNTIRKSAQGPEKVLGTQMIQPWDAVDPSTYDPSARLALLDEVGVYAQILFPNAIGFASNSIFGIDDAETRDLVQSIYNDFLIDVQHDSGGRLLPQGVLPIWDMEQTVAEMARLRNAGITGFTLTDKPQSVGLPDLDSPYFAPMWALGNEMGAVFNFHIGSGGGRGRVTDPVMVDVVRRGSVTAFPNPDLYWESFGPQRRLAILATQFYMSNVRVIVNFCMSDMFDRYPNITINSAESGVGWIPFILEAMEYQLDEMVTEPSEAKLSEKRPTEHFHDHFLVTFWFEKVGPTKTLEDIGIRNVVVETDIPHPTCTYPQSKAMLTEVATKLDPYARRRVFQDNAAEAYGIVVPTA
ncbi:MAG: amidohydrolase family protein [Acidimicrobiia bacterium]